MEEVDEMFDRLAKAWVDAFFSGKLTEDALNDFLNKFGKVFEIKDPLQKKLYLISCYAECLWKSKLQACD